MVRVITQETFDCVVKENMEEFDMGKEDAIKEAKDQFETQVICNNRQIRNLYSRWLIISPFFMLVLQHHLNNFSGSRPIKYRTFY